MSDIQIFEKPVFGKIRATVFQGEPWFVAVDVCKALGHTNPTMAVAGLDDDERAKLSLGRQGEMNCVNEAGLYTLVIKSHKPEAKAFRRWITHEVLPSIRANGGYIHGAQDMTDMEIVSKAFLIAQKTIEARDARINALESDNRALTESNAALTAEIAAFEPVKTYYEQILSSTGTLTTTQIAADYDLSAQKLNKILHEEGVQYKVNGQWILYTAYAGNGYTKSITIPIVRANGTPDAKLHTQWTQKGRLMIHDILTERGIMAKADRMAAAS